MMVNILNNVVLLSSILENLDLTPFAPTVVYDRFILIFLIIESYFYLGLGSA
jgi:hypothetical protein